jgi:hypothetical protein
MGQAQQGMGTTASFPHSEPDTLERQTSVEADANKLTKEEVSYRAAGRSATRCSSCAHYQGDGICAVVAGPVDPDGVSDMWEPRDKGLRDLVAAPPVGGPV